jgi:tripartite-type tricarboxylate transporter receptor subunit TctC
MRRDLLAAILVALAAPAQGNPVDNYPNRPARIVVPFAPGGPTDTYGRKAATTASRTS